MKYTQNDVDYIIPLVFCHGLINYFTNWRTHRFRNKNTSNIKFNWSGPEQYLGPKRMDTIKFDINKFDASRLPHIENPEFTVFDYKAETCR